MDTELIKYLVTNFGFSTVILAIWYFCHKTWSAQLNGLIENQTKHQENTFALLKDMIDVNILQVGKLEKIEKLIESNSWCPYLRKMMKEDKE